MEKRKYESKYATLMNTKKTATISIWYKISWLEKLGGPGKIFWKVYDAVVP